MARRQPPPFSGSLLDNAGVRETEQPPPDEALAAGQTAERLAAGVGAVVPVLATLVLAVIGWQTPGYDPIRRTVSRLAEPGAPFALEVKLVLVSLGLSLVAVAWALDRRLTRGAAARTLPLAIAGLGIVGVALISRDAAHAAVLALHRLIAVALFCALATAPLVMAGRLRADPSLRGYAMPSVATAGLSIALIAVGVLGVVLGGLPSGAWERAFLGLNLAWVTLLAIRLLRAGPTGPIARR